MFAKKRSGPAQPRASRLTLFLKGLVAAVVLSSAFTSAAQAQSPSRSNLALLRLNGPRGPRPPGWVQRFINPGVLSSLNPQPLPPRVFGSAVTRVNPGVLSSLNPQPLPPRVFGNTVGRINPGVLSSLNPQPLPPRSATTGLNLRFGR
jgi:hypothetical protein